MQKLLSTENPPVVTHLTRVSLDLAPNPGDYEGACQGAIGPETVRKIGQLAKSRAERVAAMMEFMAGLGFSFEAGRNSIRCYSNEVEAGDIKRMLLAAGFRDRDFQIVLEYTRGWGML